MSAGHSSDQSVLENFLHFYYGKKEKKSFNPNAITFYIIIIFKGYVKLKRINSSLAVYI